MYVCLCNGYREAEIHEMAQTGIRCARSAYVELGAGPQCGRCLPLAQELIDQVHERVPVEGISLSIARKVAA